MKMEKVETPLLELRNVTKIFKVGGIYGGKEIRAVEDVSFILPDKPFITALVGESGSGKTTIARMILGLIEPTYGSVLYKGRTIQDWLKRDWLTFRREVQPIFQDPYEVYNPFYRVDRIFRIVIKKFKLAPNEKEAQKMIENVLRAIGLRPEDVLGRYPHQLSGGERQRLMLARILLIKPKLIVADEPVSMIDVSLRAIFLEQLRELKEKLSAACLYITHDFNVAYYISDYVIVLNYGRIVERGDMEEVVREPLHPYTQLLINSIPNPDPKKRWKEKLKFKELSRELRPEKGCVFQERCPHVMPQCREKTPPLIEAKPNHYVACFLYEK